MITADHLSSTFAALADPTRRALLDRLAGGEASVTELAAPFEISLPAVSRHLKVLERAGLIARSRDAQWRRCRLEVEPLREAAGWLEGYRAFWADRLDRLDAYLQGAPEDGPPPGSRDRAARAPGPRAARTRKRSASGR